MKTLNEFNVFGHKIKIKYQENLERDNCVGYFSYSENLICVESSSKGKKKDKSMVDQTVCHEIVHCWFDHLNRPDLSENETLVDNMGSLLHQLLSTAK